MIKILAYNYPTSADIAMQRTVAPMHFSVFKSDVQETIKKLLFEGRHNYLLIGIDGKMFICEPMSIETKQYSRREIFYHPNQNDVVSNK
jgi:hypothetical protein